MLKSYFTLALRNFFKHKFFSFINLGGLVLGITSSLIIVQYAHHEMSYDNFHKDKQNIYRIRAENWAAGPAGLAPALKENIPEVEKAVKIRTSFAAMTYKSNVFKESKAYFATQDFFDIFSFDILQRADSLPLSAPNKMALSRSTATKYFADENPIGKTMTMNGLIGQREFIVTAVYTDPPENSHFKPDILFSFEAFAQNEAARSSFGWYGFWTYIKVRDGVTKEGIQSKITEFETNREKGESDPTDFGVQPIEDIHLNSHLKEEFEVNGSASAVTGLLIVAAFIIVIAWLNFISLSVGRAMQRAKEMGMRKVMGSSRNQLAIQFMTESVIMNVLAGTLGFILAFLLLPYFESMVGKSLTSNLFQEVDFWYVFPTILLLGAFLSGLYPAFVMSRYRSVDTLQGSFKNSGRGQLVRKAIVIFQFAISVVLLICTLVIYEQISFMQKKNLGIDVNQTIVLDGPSNRDSTYTSRYLSFKTELLRSPSILGLTTSSDIPGKSITTNNGGARFETTPDTDAEVPFRLIDIDYDFIPTYKLSLLAGHNFSKNRNTVTNPILINKKGLEELGITNPEEVIGKKIVFWGRPNEVIGVLDDYHQDSPKGEYQNLIFRPLWDTPAWQTLYSIKIDGKPSQEMVNSISQTYSAFFPESPFNHFFLEDQYVSQYQTEKLFNTLFNLFSGLAIFIACLGLFGLTMYMIFQRMREIGIRKVLGASAGQIGLLLGNHFLKMVAISCISGIPIAWYLMKNWLGDFAFRIGLAWWHFALPITMLLAIALITVFQQVSKAAATNPVDTFKDG